MAPAPPFIAAKYHGGGQSSIDRIVIHGTVSPTVAGGALAVAHYFQNPPSEVSAHYIVDPATEYQCVFDHTIAWHDGTNTNSIGVELCDPVDGPADRWQDGPHQEMLARAASLVRDLCDSYGVPIVKLSGADIRAGRHGICGHVDMRDAFPASTTHYDPGPAFPWGQFMSLVAGGTPPQEDDLTPDQANRLILIEQEVRSVQNQLSGNAKGDPVFDARMNPTPLSDWGWLSKVDDKTRLSLVDFIRYIDLATNGTQKEVAALSAKVDAIAAAVLPKPAGGEQA
jgi:N-acetyl-anhydromuramyl-L-alanine amidase AmpD